MAEAAKLNSTAAGRNPPSPPMCNQLRRLLLSVCADATQHRLNPWSYLRDVLDQLAARSAGEEVGDLLPDAWAIRHG